MENSSFANLGRAQLILALSGMVLTLLTATINQTISITAMPRAIPSLNGSARYSWPTTSFLLLTSTGSSRRAPCGQHYPMQQRRNEWNAMV
jgi:hypothetical protein